MDAPHIETAHLAENLGVKPTINKNEGAPLQNEEEGFEENEVPLTNAQDVDLQQQNDDPQPMRRS
jgi:hypothetical protein